MKKSIHRLFPLFLLLLTSAVFADHGRGGDPQLKLALDFSGDKIRLSSIKLKKHKSRLVSLRIVLNNKRKRKEISDDDYKVKIKIIEECEHECLEIDEEIVQFRAVIKIKTVEFNNGNVKIKIEDEKVDRKHHHHDYDEDEDDDHHHHHHKHKHKHKHHDNCPACRNEKETTYEIRVK